MKESDLIARSITKRNNIIEGRTGSPEVVGAEIAYLNSAIRGQEFYIAELERNPELFQDAQERLRKALEIEQAVINNTPEDMKGIIEEMVVSYSMYYPTEAELEEITSKETETNKLFKFCTWLFTSRGKKRMHESSLNYLKEELNDIQYGLNGLPEEVDALTARMLTEIRELELSISEKNNKPKSIELSKYLLGSALTQEYFADENIIETLKSGLKVPTAVPGVTGRKISLVFELRARLTELRHIAENAGIDFARIRGDDGKCR